MLKEKTLFGYIDKKRTAIARLKEFEPKEGYYLAFSGGKDSVVIKKLADLSSVKYDAHFSNTTIEFPETIYYIRKYHKDVAWDNPEIPFLKLLETRGYPRRQGRWCCEAYKEKCGQGRIVITGIRWEESHKRSQRKMVEVCLKDKSKKFLNVIIDWTEKDIWEFIKKYKLPYCELYDKGFKRLGCMFCPMTYKRQKIKELNLYPRHRDLFIKAFEKLYRNRKISSCKSVNYWKNGKDMFYHWITDSSKGNPDQTIMFE